VGHITAASGEQSAGIEQVNQAVVQIDNVTQQNAALVEEATAAAGSLHDQASMLAQLVSVFTLSGESGKPVPARVATIPAVSVKLSSPAASYSPGRLAKAGAEWGTF
jgi:hypothetical protein